MLLRCLFYFRRLSALPTDAVPNDLFSRHFVNQIAGLQYVNAFVYPQTIYRNQPLSLFLLICTLYCNYYYLISSLPLGWLGQEKMLIPQLRDRIIPLAQQIHMLNDVGYPRGVLCDRMIQRNIAPITKCPIWLIGFLRLVNPLQFL